MKRLLVIILFCIFIIHKDIVVISALEGLNIWIYKLFPLLLPTFILSDLVLSTDLIDILVKRFGDIYKKIFKNNKIGLFIFLISILSGTPNNAKVLSELKKNNILNDSEINKVLCSSIMFNPLLIISIGGIKLLFILIISNIITGIMLRNIKVIDSNTDYKIKYKFDINDSISKSINILINILGTIVVYSVIINLIPFNNVYLKLFSNILFELSNALNFNSMFFNNSLIVSGIIFSFGGLSIFTQIKSILKDTFIDFNLLIKSRLICTCICVIICWFT